MLYGSRFPALGGLFPALVDDLLQSLYGVVVYPLFLDVFSVEKIIIYHFWRNYFVVRNIDSYFLEKPQLKIDIWDHIGHFDFSLFSWIS